MALDPKDPDVPATYSIDWRKTLVDEAMRSTEYAIDDIRRPQFATGFYLKCTTAGLTSKHYPTWPRAAAETVQDGSAVWTVVHPDDATVPTVQSATWTLEPGITKDSQSETDTHTHITLSGGTDGEDYELTCRMTPSTGAAIERSIIVPVRSQ